MPRAAPAATKAEIFALRGSHDGFYMEYPATPGEALAPEEFDRRLPFGWVQACCTTDDLPLAPALPGRSVWRAPVAGRGT